MPDQRILIAEASPVVAMDLEITLAEAGYLVIGVVNRVSELTEMMGKVQYDVLLLSVDLADGTTLPVARECKKQIVFLTAHETYELPSDLRRTPMLSKPFISDDVMHLLATLTA